MENLLYRKEFVINGRYTLVRKIGNGSFGDIYLGVNKVDKKEVAVKVESLTSSCPQLLYESRVYNILKGGNGIPRVKWFGQELHFNLLVMDLLGPSLEDLFKSCSQRFSMKTVLMLADQMLERIEYVHDKSFLHRDIKPDNFLMGLGLKCNTVHLIDFGLSKKYRDFQTHRHMAYRNDKSLTGTPRYASINAHVGIEQSRRDDLESLGNVLIYFIRGSLPWQGIGGATQKRKHQLIMEKKISISVESLCKDLPREFSIYMNYVRALPFDATPDYTYLRNVYRNLFRTLNYRRDYVFDWTLLNQNKKANEGYKMYEPISSEGYYTRSRARR